MEIKPSEVKEGQEFYAVDVNSTYPDFNKYTCTKATAKQIRAKRITSYATSYEYTLRSGTYRFFDDFASARDLWVTQKIEKDIQQAEMLLANAKSRREELLSASDI